MGCCGSKRGGGSRPWSKVSEPVKPPRRGKVELPLGAVSADFGLGLVRELGGAEDVFVSPASLLVALGMTFGGADGATRDQMAAALFLGLKDSDVHQGLGDLVRLLRPDPPPPNELPEDRDFRLAGISYELACANRLYAQKDMDFERAFLDLCAEKYLSSLRPVDFKSSEGRSAAVSEVNAWVAEQTKGLIRDIVEEGNFDETIEKVMGRVPSQLVSLRAEEVPLDQVSVEAKTEFLLPVAHFHKEPMSSFGIPFLIKVKNGEKFSVVRQRVQELLCVQEKEFDKFKFALVKPSVMKPTYLEDMENCTVNLGDLTGAAGSPGSRPWLGLDHVNKHRQGARGYVPEKAIVIHN